MTQSEPLELSPFDPSRYLTCDEAIEAYFNDAWDSESPLEIADALVVIAKARGAEDAAAAEGLPRDFRQTSVAAKDVPDWPTLLRVVKALGLKLMAVTIKPAA